MSSDDEKRIAAETSAQLVESGMNVGLGTGSTVHHLLPALAERSLKLTCVATSVATEVEAKRLGLQVEDFGSIKKLDIAIDGADQIDPDRWLVKGGGAAHTREKIVAATAERFVVIADSTKPVDEISEPIPLELHAYGLASTLRRLNDDVGKVELRKDTPPSPDGGVIADYRGKVGDLAKLAARLADFPGVVDHGLFPPEMVSAVIIGRGEDVEES